ncbi:PQQ-dependent sugar dehydrogenase [Bacillus salitolerans]|uniref:PQQ-dependent sugar dehydrogenase n=1 Tax=Bacillus salitolerans TaxID=1437434 RepID=A0ABW4LXA6_9BACI
MRRTLVYILIVLLIGCSRSTDEIHEVTLPIREVPIQNAEIIASNLVVPWDIVKTGEEYFVSERGGTIVHIDRKGNKTNMSLELSKDVAEYGEGGLLGFILHPDYQKNALAYIYYTYQDNGNINNQIVKVKKEGSTWIEESVLLSDLPGARIHNGGRIEIGPDQKLYASVGDAANPDSAQQLNSLAGKIIRMNLDGTIPENNPFENSYIYSFGHRNPQGFAWTEAGEMYSAEHGAEGHDEINRILPGQNYGWPLVQGDEQREGMLVPIFHSGEDTWAPSGLAYQEGRLLVAGLAGQQIRVFDLRENESFPLYEDIGRIRDLLVVGKDLYIITNNTDGRGVPDEDDDHLLKVKLE